MKQNKKIVIKFVAFLLFICSGYIKAQQLQGDALAPLSGRRNIKEMQIIDQGNLRCSYAFNADDVKDINSYIDLQYLEIGKYVSKYYSCFIFNNDSLIYEWCQKYPKATSVKRQMGPLGKKPYHWSEYKYSDLFKYYKKNVMIVYSRMPHGLNIYDSKYNERIPLQIWELKPETLTVNGYLCHKATCSFRGRKYIAWYTKEIPVSNGPWKFGGLPGLILKVYDTQKLYTFECVKIEYFKFPIKQYEYSTYKELPRKEVLKLEREINENYFKVSKSRSRKTREYLSKFTPYQPMELN